MLNSLYYTYYIYIILAPWNQINITVSPPYPHHHKITTISNGRLSALKHENPARCARISTKQRTKKGGGSSGKEIKQVISGLEDDLGALTL